MPISVEKYNTVFSYYEQFWKVVINDMPLANRAVLIGFWVLTLYYCIAGRKRVRAYFGIQGLLQLIFIEPHVMFVLAKNGFDGRYFRFLWIWPYTVTYGYFVTNLAFRLPWKTKKAKTGAAYILSIVLLAAGGCEVMAATAGLYNGPEENVVMNRVENIYKVEDDTIVVSGLIAADQHRASWAADPETGGADDGPVVDGVKNSDHAVKALYGYDTCMDLRTYDPSIYSGLPMKSSQTRYNNRAYDDATLERVYGEERYDDLLSLLINGKKTEAPVTFSADKVRQALEAQSYQYVIVPKKKDSVQLFGQCGETIGESENYLVIRVGLRAEDRGGMG